jgi:hypothetical protein
VDDTRVGVIGQGAGADLGRRLRGSDRLAAPDWMGLLDLFERTIRPLRTGRGQVSGVQVGLHNPEATDCRRV